MKLTFLGTGTSMGVPTAGGLGRDRAAGDPRDQRWRCSAWIRNRDTSIVIDTGPEFRLQTLRAGIQHIDAVLITHEHMDHIAGLDDLRPFTFKQAEEIPVYTTEKCIESIKSRFDYMFGPDRYPGAPALDLQVIDGPLQIDGLQITPLPVIHGKVDVLGFRINNFSYMTDVKAIPAATREKIAGSDVMVLSGLRWEPEHPTHLTIPEAIELATELEVPMTYLIHMNSYVSYAESHERMPDHVRLAYDQLTLEL
ncbi:MAG: MBL fold metallo-hydrolase [Balneolaceae bacterium]|nr:MBL fold metallo-hydrolase [Balneolaceae bacterium]